MSNDAQELNPTDIVISVGTKYAYLNTFKGQIQVNFISDSEQNDS